MRARLHPVQVGSIFRVLKENGAGDEDRTHDIHLGKVALYR
jgi:hypothetical protein